MKNAKQFGKEAYSAGINRPCDDSAFMAAMVERKESKVTYNLRAWKQGYSEARFATVYASMGAK